MQMVYRMEGRFSKIFLGTFSEFIFRSKYSLCFKIFAYRRFLPLAYRQSIFSFSLIFWLFSGSRTSFPSSKFLASLVYFVIFVSSL